MHAICESCCKANLIKFLIQKSTLVGQCSVCKILDAQVVETNERDFVLAIKSLIRYHHSERDYHGRLGGETLQTLFTTADNPFINVNPKLDDLEFEEFLLSFLENIDDDQQISLFTAYGRDIYNYFDKRAIRYGDCPEVETVASELSKRNHFLVEADFEERFKIISEYVSQTIDAGAIWHRARIGATVKAAMSDFSSMQETYYYKPYSDQTLSAPPVGTTSAGRMNRPGVSYLYLASDQDTAVAEVRPHPAEIVSLGSFSLTIEQKIADLSNHQLMKLFRTDKELEILQMIISMERAFSMAAPPSNRQLYSLTQFLAEMLRRLGFDGVKFTSTVGKGINLLLFNPDVVTWVPDSSRVVEVHRVIYEHEDKKLHDPEGKYDIDFSDIGRNH